MERRAAAGRAPGGSVDPERPVHLLLGEEVWLRDRRAAELIARFAPAENAAYNQETFHGPEIDLDSVVAACNTLPVFADRRLVVVRNLELKAAAAHTGLVAYLRDPNPQTVLLIVTQTAAARRGEDGEGEPVRAKGRIPVKELLGLIVSREEFPAMRPERAQEYVRQAARARGVEIGVPVAQALVELVGVDGGRLDDEVEKAALFAGERRRIELKDIEALARRTRGHTMFELTDALATGDREGVLRHLGALIEDGAEPVALVGMIAWHLRRTLKGAVLAQAGRAPAEIAREVGAHWRTGERFAATCARLGTLGVARAIRALRVADRQIKSTAEEKRRVLERTLLALLAQPE